MSTNKPISKLSRVKEKLSFVSFVSIASACDDILIEAKLKFFVAVAKSLQKFLLKFQTKAPMTPFLALSLKDLLLAIMGCFLKKEKTDTSKKLSTIGPADKKNQTMITFSFAA